MERNRQITYIVLGAAVATVIGVFLPWIRVSAPFLGTITKAGINGDGKLLLVLAAVIGGLALLELTRRAGIALRVALVASSGLAVLFMVIEAIVTSVQFADIGRQMTAASSGSGGDDSLLGGLTATLAQAVSYGFDIGFFLSCLGAAVCLGASLFLLRDSRAQLRTVPGEIPAPVGS